MAGPRSRGVARLAALRVLPPDKSRQPERTEAADPADGVFATLLAGFPDALVLCDSHLAPVHSSAAARWLVCDGGWAGTPAAAACREAAAAALDAGGVASITFTRDGTQWQARAAPLDDARTPVCVAARPATDWKDAAVLRTAHDLKAPLHAIHGFGALLLRESMGPVSAAQRRALETIVAETDRLRRSLNGLLDQVRTGAAGTDDASADAQTDQPPPTCDLGAVAHETAHRFDAFAQLRAVRLEAVGTAALAAALAEQDARTILENLVANALAATPERGSVRVIVEEGTPGSVTCRVEDSGPGIPQAVLERIFEPRFRLPDRGSPDGTGLGLAIARELASRAGGTLVAANRAQGGAVFTLSVPRAAAHRRRVLHLAPVTSYTALARAHALLDLVPGWQTHSWEDGVLTVELSPEADVRLEALAAQHGLVCWAAG